MASVPSGTDWASDPEHRDVMRARLILRDGPWCHYCRRRFSSRGRRASFEHIWPRAMGRIDLDWNLVLACRDCNSARGTNLAACSCEWCRTAISRAQGVLGVAA